MKPEDIQDLKELIEFLKQHGVAEFDVDRGDLKLRLKFNQPAPALADLARTWPVPASPIPPFPQAQVAPSSLVPTSAPVLAPEPAEDLHLVKSPIVGTFYGSPSPGAPSFVSPGDHVEKGQVICIVEAMKLMNEIEADASGEIVKCLVTNGQPIEFGQPLFSIRVN